MNNAMKNKIFLGLTLTETLIQQLNPEANAGNWIAGIFGAFLLRLLIRNITTRQHLTGWLVGSIAAFLWANTIHRKYLPDWDTFAVWGAVGFAGDLILQTVVLLLAYVRDNPGEAFDSGLQRAEKVAGLWATLKQPFLDIFKSKRTE